MNTILAENIPAIYKSQTQKIRVITENWLLSEGYCPNCGLSHFNKYPNNTPVADFYCPNCNEDYELKSKNGIFRRKIVDGAFYSMIERLNSDKIPNLFLLSYDLVSYKVINFFIIPKHFFIPDMIEKRKPLAVTAKRAGWIGCNIILQNIPSVGRIYLIKENIVNAKMLVMSQWKKTLFLRDEKNMQVKGWTFEIMKCIEKMDKTIFRLEDIYSFEKELQVKYPDNSHIKDKIRQQLQILRDKGYLKFNNNGVYQIL